MSATVPYSVTRAERSETVHRLRAAGLKNAEIAAKLGISKSYVCDLTYDPDGSKQAARVASYRGTCEDCGGPTSNGNNTAVPTVCAACHLKRIKPPHGTHSRYSSGCSCDECRRANRDHMRSLKGRTPPTHSYSGYTNYGCRCDVCRDAHLVYSRANPEPQRRWQEKVRGTTPKTHGASGYKNYGCRCDVCCAAARAQQKRSRLRKTAA